MTPRVLSWLPSPRKSRQERSHGEREKASTAPAPVRAYKNFTPEEREHHSLSLLQLKHAKRQVPEWLKARKFESKLDRVIADGLAAIESDVQVGEDSSLHCVRKDPQTIGLELDQFFDSKAAVLADVYSAVPDELMPSIVRSARRLMRTSRAAGQAKLNKLIDHQRELPRSVLKNWVDVKMQHERFKNKTMIIDEHAHAPHDWVHSLVELAYKLETAQALIPTYERGTDGPAEDEYDRSIDQLDQAREQAKAHGDLLLAQDCAGLMERFDRERHSHLNATELLEQKVKLLVKVWSTYFQGNDYDKSVMLAIEAAKDRLDAVRRCALSSGSDLRTTFNELQILYVALGKVYKIHAENPLERALRIKFEAEQLLHDAMKATTHTRARLVDVRHSLAHDGQLSHHSANLSPRTARRYAL